MSTVAIAKVHQGDRETASFLAEMKVWTDRIRERAFSLFQGRGSKDGRALDDWLEAERDLSLATESELTEKDAKYEVRMAAAAFTEKEIVVTALPDAQLIRAETSHRNEKHEGDVHSTEFGETKLFRRFDLPKAIDVDKVAAQLNKGILRVTAVKAQSAAATAA